MFTPISPMTNRNLLSSLLLSIAFFLSLPCAVTQTQTPEKNTPAELKMSRPVRPWEFMPAVGRKAALFGHESGTVEGWVYPMKVFRDFSLVFRVADREIPASTLARTIE